MALALRELPNSTRVELGDPSVAILASSRRVAAQMIVMATHGRGGLNRLFAGSVAEAVARGAICPVLLVPPAPTGHSHPPLIQRVLVPLDGSPLAERALPVATAIARACGASLSAVRAEPSFMGWTDEAGPGDELLIEAEAVSEAMRAYLAAATQRVPPSIRCEPIVLRSSARQLPACTRDRVADPVVMVSHRRLGVSRMLHGSVAGAMVRAGLPTLLVPLGGHEEEHLGGAGRRRDGSRDVRCDRKGPSQGCSRGREIAEQGAVARRCPATARPQPCRGYPAAETGSRHDAEHHAARQRTR